MLEAEPGLVGLVEMVAPLLREALSLLGVVEPQIDDVAVGKQQPRALARKPRCEQVLVFGVAGDRARRAAAPTASCRGGRHTRRRAHRSSGDRSRRHRGYRRAAQHRRPLDHGDRAKAERQALDHDQAAAHHLLVELEQQRLELDARPARLGEGRAVAPGRRRRNRRSPRPTPRARPSAAPAAKRMAPRAGAALARSADRVASPNSIARGERHAQFPVDRPETSARVLMNLLRNPVVAMRKENGATGYEISLQLRRRVRDGGIP